jgi:hypothetical protein
MTHRNTGIFIVTLITLVLGASNSARATLLAYEGFDYTPGDSLTNASQQSSGGSFGWGIWEHPGD